MIPRSGRPAGIAQSKPEHITSMCLEIPPFKHADCVAAYCVCPCHIRPVAS